MEYISYTINLDMHRAGSQYFLSMKQGDSLRRLMIRLSENGLPYEIEEDCIAVFAAKKPDGTMIFNNCSLEEDNCLVYTVTDQTTAAVGELDCELRLYSHDSRLICSPRFTIQVNPAVYPESGLIESVTEVSALTGLVGEAGRLIADVNEALSEGEFIPKLSIGTVTTLSAGSSATVEITGTGEAPVLNFGIPQGDEGQAESMIPDAEFSEYSTKPIQNRPVTIALRELREDMNTGMGILESGKVDKEEGKGLSANDFTDELLSKLEGIEAGANKYSLPVAGDTLGGVKSGGDIYVSADGEVSIVSGVVSTQFYITFPADGWAADDTGMYANTVAAEGILVTDAPIVDLFIGEETAETVEALNEIWGQIAKIDVSSGTVTAYFLEAPTIDIPIKMVVIRK